MIPREMVRTLSMALSFQLKDTMYVIGVWQRWVVTESSNDDWAGQLSTVKINSAVDGSYLLNVGESAFTQLELQLYASQHEQVSSSGATPENEIFRLDATGMLQASIADKNGCVDVCVAGSKACAGSV